MHIYNEHWADLMHLIHKSRLSPPTSTKKCFEGPSPRSSTRKKLIFAKVSIIDWWWCRPCRRTRISPETCQSACHWIFIFLFCRLFKNKSGKRRLLSNQKDHLAELKIVKKRFKDIFPKMIKSWEGEKNFTGEASQVFVLSIIEAKLSKKKSYLQANYT